MTTDNYMKVGGLVLCKRKKMQRNKLYAFGWGREDIFRWRREDVVRNADQIPKFLSWLKENILFIAQWHPVDREEWEAWEEGE